METQELNAQFGAVSIAEERARIGIKIMRENLSLDWAADLFCGRMLHGRITVAESIDEAQERLPGMKDNLPPTVESSFEVKKFSVAPKFITASLSFSISDVDFDMLGHLAKRSGRLVIERHEPIEDDERNGEEPHPDVEAGKDRPHGHPAMEAVAAATAEPKDQGVDTSQLNWAANVVMIDEYGELDTEYLVGSKIKELIEGTKIKAMTESKRRSLCIHLDDADSIADIAAKLRSNNDCWKGAKRWTDADGETLKTLFIELAKAIEQADGEGDTIFGS